MKKNVNKHNVDYVKRLAKKLKKEQNISHHEALNLTVEKFGFNNWKHFLNENKESIETKKHNPYDKLSIVDINKLIGLCHNGFSNGNEKIDSSTFSEIQKIEKIRAEIKKYFTKTKSFNLKRSSYGLKHELERHLGNYVTNGELIYAMYLEGYKIKRCDINCYFNISSVGLKNLTISNKLLESFKVSWEYELEDYLKFRKRLKKFKRNKYHFDLIISLLFQNDIPKKNVYGVIGAEIGETSETIKQWFTIENDESIPEEKLIALSKIFNFKPEKLKNF
ncbi:hypothetical protein [Winogradskyella vidalii]|uniref:hypothetical protein n=1 Tax=Winogradskyella vidalii TaxID=2615024 RepID=UPI0015C81167|nr:hypothetical protein [Winogradskyella vidalii]